jgi:ABC-2 type transport system permease protein
MNTLTYSSPKWLPLLLTEWRMELVKLWRQPSFVLPALLFPGMFYVLFSKLMGGNKNMLDAGKFLLANYSAFGVISPALFGIGIAIATERDNGWLKLRRASALPPLPYLLAKLMACMVFALAIYFSMIALAVTVGGVRMPLHNWLGLGSALILGCLPFCALGLWIGSSVKANAAPGIVNAIYLPMAALSGLWWPISMLPRFMQTFALILPTYHFGRIARGAVGIEATPTFANALVLLLFLVVFLALATRAFARNWKR